MKKQSCSNPENICIDPAEPNHKNHKFDARNFLESQRYAISGLKLIVINERNFRTQLLVATSVVLVGLLLEVSHRDWIALMLVIALVLVAEAFNSVIEAVCDTISHDFRVNIRYAKNVSAGAVLVSAIVSAITGVFIFAPYVLTALDQVLSTL
ncbi:MAG: diacylglycerol kinase family protein [Patescibacteria group bacterium]|nr:diacylglycerol kinase family protein [Patescibacteria group bacterium]